MRARTLSLWAAGLVLAVCLVIAVAIPSFTCRQGQILEPESAAFDSPNGWVCREGAVGYSAISRMPVKLAVAAAGLLGAVALVALSRRPSPGE
jgi:hypothetical protein